MITEPVDINAVVVENFGFPGEHQLIIDRVEVFHMHFADVVTNMISLS